MDCRFCLFPQEDIHNPLISPCSCTGSVQYVHVQCLRRWRSITENPDAAMRCQLCLENFDVFLRWPLETVPKLRVGHTWFVFTKPLLISTFLYYINALLCFHTMKNTRLPTYNSILMFYLYENQSQPFFFASVIAITIFYFLTLVPYVYSIHSKSIYARYWMKTEIQGVHPRNLLVYVLLNFMLTYFYAYPFGLFYIFSLPKLFLAHEQIIRRMNADAQMF
jgi:hypothetical protein